MQYHAEILSFVLSQRMKKPLTTAGEAMLSYSLKALLSDIPGCTARQIMFRSQVHVSARRLSSRISGLNVAGKMRQT